MSWSATVPATPRTDFLNAANAAINAVLDSQDVLTASDWRKLTRQISCVRIVLIAQRDSIDGDFLAASVSGHVGDFSSLYVGVYATAAPPAPQPAAEAPPEAVDATAAAAQGGEAA